MGTNFYLTRHTFEFEPEDADFYTERDQDESLDSDDPRFHIGKRSAAGPYCWDCGVTLCKDGEARVHHDSKWHDECPVCGKAPVPVDGLKEGAGAVELGFAKPASVRPEEVRSCASFTWAQPLGHFQVFAREHLDEEIVVDEYERSMTGRAFLKMLEMNCPIQLKNSIGGWFC